MAQVFADDDQVAASGMLTRVVPIPRQSLSLGSALMPGKGVRKVRCVGCSEDTLPRNDDGAPICDRCCERLAETDPAIDPMSFWAPRWLRRRPHAPAEP